ncbi:hypothetical protein CYY_004461 [Polysphondylium violaceum]|uniref:WD40 repeat-containing protein n=1 Tax=Polysphondylium violaceum TaxID=133409 RepID=A0A8J4PV83_9MYCE|nr:hypothetical protein CYY_004461 [Polysphondylium violaceum]
MSTSSSIHYTTHKINKIRWYSKSFHNDLSLFVTGTNHSVISKNKISIWELESRSNSDEVKEISSMPVDGIVTELKMFEYNHKPMILSSTTEGKLSLFSIFNLPCKFEYVGYNKAANNNNNSDESMSNNDNNTFETCNLFKEKSWDNSNGINCFDTTLDYHNIATVGQDGALNILSLDSFKPIQTIKNIDGLYINTIKYTNKNELITSGENPLIKIWDTRVDSNTPVKSINSNLGSIHCLAVHPDQPHIIAAGGSNGQVYLFDTRNSFSIDQNKIHNSNVWELSFSKMNPNQLYSCSEDGTISLYDYSKDNSIMSTGNTFDIYNKESSHVMIPGGIGPIDSFDINNHNRLISSSSSQCLVVKSL